MDRVGYFNDMLVRLEELLYHELSGCAAWKVELVGVDFIQSKPIRGRTEEEVIVRCIEEITAAGLVQSLSYAIGGRGIRLGLEVTGCLHLPKEARLKEEGISPYICPIANMILDQLIEKLSYETTYLARLDIDGKAGRCNVTCAIYATAEKIGDVSDWSQDRIG